MTNSGNNCNHLKNVPRFFEAHFFDRLPNFCRQAVEKCKDYYYHSQTFLPLLNDISATNRQKRSERREAIALTLQTLIHYMQLHTHEVGFVTKKGVDLRAVSLVFFAKKAAISLKRLSRSLDDLKKAGYIATQYEYQELNGRSIRFVRLKLTDLCLRHLGFSSYLIEKVKKFKERQLSKLAPISTEYQPFSSSSTSTRALRDTYIDKMKKLLAKVKFVPASGRKRISPNALSKSKNRL